jgi:tetratricopeptide (TPR) repeat protein
MILEKLQDASDINQDTLKNGQATIDGSWGIYYGNVKNFSEQHVRFVSMFESGHHKEDHPLMTDIYAKLGEANKNLGYYDVAEHYMQKSLCQKRREDCRFRGPALKIWGDLYFIQHKLDLALEKFKEALDYQKRVFKEDHPELAQLYRRMGEVYRDQGKAKEAEFYILKALEIQKIAFDENHPEYVISLKSLNQLAFL